MSASILSHDRPQDFVQSRWQKKEKSLIFFIYRWTLACFFVFAVEYSLTTHAIQHDVVIYFIYLTNINLCLSMVMTVIAATLVTLRHLDFFNPKHEMPACLKIYWVLWNITTTFAPLISMTYWILMHKGDGIGLVDFLTHIMNTVTLCLDVLIVRHPPRFSHLIFSWTALAAFAAFSAIFQFLGGVNKNGGNFVYETCDWKDHPIRAAIILAILFASLTIFHGIMTIVLRLKYPNSEAVTEVNGKAESQRLTSQH